MRGKNVKNIKKSKEFIEKNVLNALGYRIINDENIYEIQTWQRQ